MMSADELRFYECITPLIAAKADQRDQLAQLIRQLQALDVARRGVEVLRCMIEEIDGETAVLQAKKAEVERFITSIPPPDRQLFTLRYMRGFTWLQIALEMSYDESSVYRLHRQALKKYTTEGGAGHG